MNIRSVTFDRLSDAEIAAWIAIQQSNSLLDSPYFRPEFTQAVSEVRNNVEVAVLEEQGQPCGFFPFQRAFGSSSQPVGGCLSDFQAVIAAPGYTVQPLELLRACGLQSWNFDHLLSEQQAFAPFMWCEEDSPYIDLTQGFESYAEQNRGHRFLSAHPRRIRKVEREVGPVTFLPQVEEPQALETLLTWKNDQYSRTASPRLFDVPWIRDLMENLRRFRGEQFSLMLSALQIGDRVAAIALGMRSAGVYHLWFPAYDIQLQRYSPGALLIIEILKAAESLGIQRIDLGKGTEEFKQRMMNGASRVAVGAVDRRPGIGRVRNALWRTRQRIRMSQFDRPVRSLSRIRNFLAQP